MTEPGSLESALERARALLSDDQALFAMVASILAAGADGSDQAQEWARVTGYPVGDYSRSASRGRAWQSQAIPALASQVVTDPTQAAKSAAALADLASAAASVDPVDLRRVNVAAFIAAAQLAAARPPREIEPPDSVSDLLTSLVKSRPDASPIVDPSTATDDPNPTLEQPIEPEDTATLAELLAELDALTGLAVVKAEVHKQAELLRVAKLREQRGMRNPDVTKHLVFTGNPGTGKTTVARLVARIYRALGLLEKGHLVEVDRTGLVGGYLGQTEEKTAAVIERARGGVLFIDEAYALAGDQYGAAAINTLVKGIEDFRDELVVIVAGYTEPMEVFIDSNPGLSSRLRLTVFFPDYSDDELLEIFNSLATKSDYTPTAACCGALRALLAETPRDDDFGNARFVRNCFEAALVRQAWRLRDVAEPTDEQLRELTAEDLGGPPARD